MCKAKFDFMGFTEGGGDVVWFVANSRMYTKEDAIKLCQYEYDWLFEEGALGKLTPSDVREMFVAYRMGVAEEYPNGCYTFVRNGSPGSFPVWVINLYKLEVE